MEEIDDVDGTSSDPFIADALANEGDLNLTEEQKKNFRKVSFVSKFFKLIRIIVKVINFYSSYLGKFNCSACDSPSAIFFLHVPTVVLSALLINITSIYE